MSFIEAYHNLVEWNISYIGKDYEEAPQSVLKPLLDNIPFDGDGESLIKEGHWLEQYLYFCPQCGCMDSDSTGNLAEYPEAYYRTTCRSCGYLLVLVDNSLPVAWWLCSDFKVDI